MANTNDLRDEKFRIILCMIIATPALAAVQETARSTVPAIGYGVAYAVGNVFLAIWGTVIVALLA